MSIDIIFLVTLSVALISFIISILLFFKLRKQDQRLASFMSGKEGVDLEHVLIEHADSIGKIEEDLRDLVKASEYLHKAIQTSVRKVAFERYNPFPGVGGNQSFTIVLLDAFNSGVVISSLHNRDSNRVYAKGVKNGQAMHNLSEEEERVLKNALLLKGA